MNDSALIEAVRTREELYNKTHAGLKNPAIKEAAWKTVAETIGGTQAECVSRWQVLRDRYSKENRVLQLQGRSGAAASGKPEWIHLKAMNFLKSHIRKRNSVSNLPPRTSVPLEPTLPSISNDDESVWSQSTTSSPVEVQEILHVENSETENKEYTVPASCPVTPCTSSSSAASLPYLGPTGRCKKPKFDDTVTLFKETLTNMNKSLTCDETDPCNDPDSLIGKSVGLALKNIVSTRLKLQFRKKFRDLVQECEEAVLTG